MRRIPVLVSVEQCVKLVSERDVNVVGLPHVTLAFWADRSRENDPQPCGCVSLDRVLDVLRKNGVDVKET